MTFNRWYSYKNEPLKWLKKNIRAVQDITLLIRSELVKFSCFQFCVVLKVIPSLLVTPYKFSSKISETD